MVRLISFLLFTALYLECSLIRAQLPVAELEQYAHFVVQEEDTLVGFYDTLSLRDGKFEQYIETVFTGVGERKLHMPGKAKTNESREIRRHVIVSGYLQNGEPSGVWLYHTANFKAYSTCYGDLSWKRIDYQNRDTTVIHFSSGHDYYDKEGNLLGGERFYNLRLAYRCYNDTCTVRRIHGEKRLSFPQKEIQMMLDCITLRDFE